MCDVGEGCGLCAGCLGWSRGDGKDAVSRPDVYHPDVNVVGEFEKAGGIDACRAMVKELALKPVAAKRRLGVLLAGDKLLAAAANSLLKTAEEPPSHLCLLFLMEGNDFLPTLRSRSRLTVLSAPSHSFSARPMPEDEAQWADFLSLLSKTANDKEDKNMEDVPDILSSWTSDFLEAGNVEAAARVDGLRLLILQKKLSQTMVCDLLTLTLKEELPFELTFGGFR
jgi:DNA polymerase-3 subunit delta'